MSEEKDKIEIAIQTVIDKNKKLKKYGIPIIEFPSSLAHEFTVKLIYLNIEINDLQDLQVDMSVIYSQIQLINTRFVQIFFRDCTIKIINQIINLPHFITFDTSNIVIYIDKSINRVDINSSSFRNCYFKNLSILLGPNESIKKFNINLTNQRIEMLQLQDLEINENNNNTFIIKNCEINRIELNNIKSNIDITLDGINSDFSDTQTQLRLMESTFNNRFILINSFFNTNFELNSVSFNDDTSFQGLNIKEINLDTTFFKSDKNVNFSELLIKDHEKLNRSTSRKIKHLLERDNNKIESNYFHSYEMMARKKELNKKDVNDRIIFKLNEQVSNYGLNWNLPLFWMLLIGLYFTGLLYGKEFTEDSVILFIINICLSISALSILKFNDLGRYIIALIPAIGFYLFMCHYPNFDSNNIVKFLSIIHFEENNPNISLTESSISKLIMGYLIYHFVIAVRKDTRK